MNKIIDIIEKETDGVSFKSHKYCYDISENIGVSYDAMNDIEWKNCGETENPKKPINLKKEADKRKGLPSIITYFLDGSRHTYKVDDISYKKNVFPIIAGQIGVGCCERTDKQLKPAISFQKKLVLVLPDIAFYGDWEMEILAMDLLKEINKNERLKKFNIAFDCVKTYTRDDGEKLENKGIAIIQDYMTELEKDKVAELALANKLDQDNYLIKDGSIDYQRISSKKNSNVKNLSDKRIANNYQYVIGVSKSFDPTKCLIKNGGTNSDVIANLKPYERTPAYMYESTRAGSDVRLCIWYLRLRDARYTNSVFDGVLKIEKLVINEKEKENGVQTEEIDNITAYLLNERNPVSYGADKRWANHIYPIYLTESFVKSKYLSNNLFMQLF